MSSFGSRLKKVRTELRLSQEVLAESLGMSRASIAAVESDKNKFSQEVLCKLLLTYNVNINYLLADIGDMFVANAKQYEQEQDVFAQRVRELIDEGFKLRGL